jgi:hypothetical protein
MSKLPALRTTLLLLSLFAVPALLALAQAKPDASPAAKPPDDLTATINALDTALFDAFNNCDSAKFGSFLADDLEFYSDQGGLAIGKQAMIDQLKNFACGNLRRELAAGTLEVHPLQGFGAVEIGVHRFYRPTRPGETLQDARFIQIWQLKDGAWKITRIISLDRHSPTQ